MLLNKDSFYFKGVRKLGRLARYVDRVDEHKCRTKWFHFWITSNVI